MYILPTLKLIFFQAVLNTCSISNVNSLYQCCCKQCFAIAAYAMCYSVINPCGYWTSGTLSTLVSNRNTLYNVMGVKRHIMPVDLPQSVSISGAEINLTVRAVSTGVLCCNLAKSKSVLKMCVSKHCHEVTGFLLWLGTSCISCVVQQRSRVKDLFSLVGYHDSCLAAIRHVKSMIRKVQPRPNIRSHSALLPGLPFRKRRVIKWPGFFLRRRIALCSLKRMPVLAEYHVIDFQQIHWLRGKIPLIYCREQKAAFFSR